MKLTNKRKDIQVKSIVIAVTSAIMLVALATVSLQAAPSDQSQRATIDFLRQYFDHATPVELSADLRLDRAVTAASQFAEAVGFEADAGMLQRAAANLGTSLPSIVTYYDWSTGHWYPFNRTLYSYDGGNQASIYYQHWNGSAWIDDYRFTYTYDIEGRLSVSLYQSWDESVWVNEFRYTIGYDENGDADESLTENWDGSAWYNSSLTRTTYDGNHRVESIVTQYWVISVWDDGLRTTNTYDGSGNLTYILIENWIGVWSNQIQTTNTYNGSNQLLTSMVQMWPGAGWVNTTMDEHEYDGEDDILRRTSTWMDTDWEVTDVDTMKYNGMHQLIESVDLDPQYLDKYKDDYTYTGDGDLFEDINSAWRDGAWELEIKSTWEYSSLATAIETEALPTDFTLMQNYPNPFNPTTTIRYALARPQQVRLEIHNVLGQVVRVLENEYENAGLYESTWDGTNSGGQEVASGVYFYRLVADDFSQTRKMMLLR